MEICKVCWGIFGIVDIVIKVVVGMYDVVNVEVVVVVSCDLNCV